MKVIDLVYQTVKSCVWYDREISKEKIEDGSYETDVELSTFVFNAYSALNQAISALYNLKKIAPVITSVPRNVFGQYQVDDELDELLNIYSFKERANGEYIGLKNYEGQEGEEQGYVFVKNVPYNVKSLKFEYIKRLPFLESKYNDLDLNSYGINDTMAVVASQYAAACLSSGIDTNVSYLDKNFALSQINTLPTYGNKKLHYQTEISPTEEFNNIWQD